MGTEWHVDATGDFNNDGHSDVLWESSSGSFRRTWEMNGANLSGLVQNVGQMGAGWQVAGVGHFQQRCREQQRRISCWVGTAAPTTPQKSRQMQSGKIADIINPSGLDGTEWHLEAIGNFAG